MILNFADATTEDIYHGKNTKVARKIPKDIWSLAARKLDRLNGAHDVKDLIDPPGNRLEKLGGDLKGKYSIRISDQYRVIFKFEHGSASEVQIVDYH